MMAVLPLVLLVACADDDDSEVLDTVAVTVTDRGLEPAEMQLRIPDRIQLVVENRSATDCDFSFGPWSETIQVVTGATEALELQIPNETEVDARQAFGCADGPRGSLELLPPGGG